MNLDFNDIHGQPIEAGDLILRDGDMFEVVEFWHGAFFLAGVTIGNSRSDFIPGMGIEHKGLFYDNWNEYKKQGLEIITKGVLNERPNTSL